MNKITAWVVVGLVFAMAAVIAWFTVGWFLPLVLAIAATAALTTAIVLGQRAKRSS